MQVSVINSVIIVAIFQVFEILDYQEDIHF